MPAVVGYLRRYRRWNGKPGISLNKQKELVRKAVRDLEFDGARYRYIIEERNGESHGWPALTKAIKMADDYAERGLLLVIPTLDGVQFNLSFLELLVHVGLDERKPIYVCSGWRKPKWFCQDTNYKYKAEFPGWMLAQGDQGENFEEDVVRTARSRSLAIRRAVTAGLQMAKRNGTKLGSHRRGSHRFTIAEQRKGGAKTAQKRKVEANAPYEPWIPRMLRWQKQGDSIGQITMRLADIGALTTHGRRVGRMLVYRVLKRALS